MKRILFFILAVCSVYSVSLAKAPLGKVSVTMNDGSVINGYCENLFKHERPTIKVSPRPDGKKAVKYKATDIREVKYEVPNVRLLNIGIRYCIFIAVHC